MKFFYAFVLFCCLSFSRANANSSLSDYVIFYDNYLVEEKSFLNDSKLTTDTSYQPTPPPSPSPSPAPTPAPTPSPATPPAPLLNYAPIVFINNSGISADRIYFLGTGKNLDGTQAHFLSPDVNTGVCEIVLPSNANSADTNVSVRLSELPVSGENTYLLYLPQQISGRCYLSIDRPLYLETTDLTIAAPSVTSARDPNFYTLYQNFELTLDKEYGLFANISNVDFFSLPMGIYSRTYPSGDLLPTLDNITASGFSLDSTRSNILASVRSALVTKDASPTSEWMKLITPFYEEPYSSSSETETDLRILAAKLSLNFDTGSFTGAGNPFKQFSPIYLQNSSSGPQEAKSYMLALGDYYNRPHIVMHFRIFPANSPEATYLLTGESSTLLNLKALSGQGAEDLTIDLSQLTTLDLLGGDATSWNTAGVFSPEGTNPWYTEIAKLFSCLFTIGQLPPKADLPQPIISSDNLYFVNYRNTYFTNPTDFNLRGPWYNLYNSSMHPLMIQSDGFGLGYAYDFDDNIGLGGELHVKIQTNGILNPDNPYYEISLGSLDTKIPDPEVGFGPYTLKVNSILSSSTPIRIYYATSTGEDPTEELNVPQDGSPVITTGLYDAFLVQYSPDENPVTYKVYPKYQLVLPTGSEYRSENITQMNSIAFDRVEEEGSIFTISLPNL